MKKKELLPCSGCVKVNKSCRPTDFNNGGCGYCPMYEPLVLYKPIKIIRDRLLTNAELAEWLAKGNGELKIGHSVIQTSYTYNSCRADYPIEGDMLIRSWSDRSWRVPMYLFCKEALEK